MTPPLPSHAPVVIIGGGVIGISIAYHLGLLGVRDVVVDVDVPRAGWIGVGLATSSGATLRAGGQLAIERPHSLVASAVARFARLEADRPGALRLVLRVGMDQDYETVQLGAWDDTGKPLRAWNSRKFAFRTEYDALHRPLRSFVQGGDPSESNPKLLAQEIVFEITIYGDSADTCVC